MARIVARFVNPEAARCRPALTVHVVECPALGGGVCSETKKQRVVSAAS